MSAWKEWQLSLKDDSVSEEEMLEDKRAWERECREDDDYE